MNRKYFLSLALAAVLLFSGAASAQLQTGNIHGNVLTEDGGGGMGKGDDGGGGAARDCGGGGTEREVGGGGTAPSLRPGGGGTLRPGGGAEVPGFAKGALETLRGRVSDSKISSARTTEGRDAPLFVEAAWSGVAVGPDGAPSIHSANSLDSRPCLAASMKHVSLS